MEIKHFFIILLYRDCLKKIDSAFELCQFLIVCCSDDFITQKEYFSRLLRLCVGLINNVGGVYLVQVSTLFIGLHSLEHFFRHRSLLPIGWRMVQFTPTPEENNQYCASHSKCDTRSKPIHFLQSTPLVISRNDKNKQLTLISKRKVALN